jgi:hypothetical protein
MVVAFLRMAGYRAIDLRRITKEKGRFLNSRKRPEKIIYNLPLPYAGIIQVRYKGRPFNFGHLSKTLP